LVLHRRKDWNADLQNFFILGMVWFFHVLGNAIWLVLDHYPPSWDTAHHLTMSLGWYQLLSSPSLGIFKALAAQSSYPPLSYIIVTPFYALFGKTADVAIFFSGTLWLSILLFATYMLGRQVFNRKAGLYAAIMVSLYPLIITLERDFFLDLQLTSLVTLTVWLLLYNRNFDHRGRAILLGIALGIGTMTKWPFAFFLVAPFLVWVYETFRQVGWERKRLINLGLCLLVGGSLAAAQYLYNYLFLPSDLYNLSNIVQLVTGFSQAAGHPAWNTFAGVLYYPVTLINNQVSFLFVILFIAAIPALFKKNVRGRWALILGLVVPYILATLLPVKEQRITAPYLPIIAVISAVGLATIRRNVLRSTAMIAMSLMGVILWWANSWGIPLLPDRAALQTSWAELVVFDQHYVRSPRDYSLQTGDWKLLAFMDCITTDAATQGISLPAEVPLVANTAAYNPNTLNYYSILYEKQLQFLYTWSWMGEPLSLESYPFAYLVWKRGKNIEIAGWDEDQINNAEIYILSHPDAFTLIYQAPLPDGTDVMVYRHTPTRTANPP
jgi:4-amino-4-deoxy-L-arabinose transferase-like glycosyltransferase